MGHVSVGEVILRCYRHRDLQVPEEYMRCQCGKEFEPYNRFMQCGAISGDATTNRQ